MTESEPTLLESRSPAPPADPRSGYTLLEIAVSLVVLNVVLGGAFMVIFHANRLFSEQMSHVNLEQTGWRVMDRLANELQGANPPTVTPVVIDDSTWLRFQKVTGFSGGAITLGGFATVTFRLAAGETDNNVDDNGDGIADEGFVVLTPDGDPDSNIAGNIVGLRFDATPGGVSVAADVAVRTYRGELLQRTFTREICFRNPG